MWLTIGVLASQVLTGLILYCLGRLYGARAVERAVLQWRDEDLGFALGWRARARLWNGMMRAKWGASTAARWNLLLEEQE